jgi:sigma-B regulation protein RsbU (phosphoserine phosphatase)
MERLSTHTTDQVTLRTLFDLGRRVMSVLELDDLLRTIPSLIERIIQFDAFAIYLLDENGDTLTVGYALGYPEGVVDTIRLEVGEGLVGRAVEERRAMLVNDLSHEPDYKGYVPDMQASLVVPLIYRRRVIGALNILSAHKHAFTERDLAIVRQFGVHAATALENARLYSDAQATAQVFETLVEVAREVSSILDLDTLFTRLAPLTRRLIDHRSFAVLLVNKAAGRLDVQHLSVRYGTEVTLPSVPLGQGLVGYAALHGEPVLVGDVRSDPRYIKVADDIQSELIVPLMHQGVCIGVLALASPTLNAFDTHDVNLATLLASQFAIAIQNAQLYHDVTLNQVRLERELRFAQRVQAALLPQGPPKRIRGLDVGARFAAAHEVGGDFHDFLDPLANQLVVAVGDVSGKGVPAALYSAFASELVRSRTFRKRYQPGRVTPGLVLQAVNTILQERQLEEYYCTMCYALFDVKRRTVTLANSGLPYPLRWSAGQVHPIEQAGVPLGAFPGIEYEETVLAYETGDVFVFCSDGIFEAMNEASEEFTSARLAEVLAAHAGTPAIEVADAIFDAVRRFRGNAPQNDDMTAVVVRILQ